MQKCQQRLLLEHHRRNQGLIMRFPARFKLSLRRLCNKLSCRVIGQSPIHQTDENVAQNFGDVHVAFPNQEVRRVSGFS